MAGSWDSMVEMLLVREHEWLPSHYTDEVDIIRRLASVPRLCTQLKAWLRTLQNVCPVDESRSNKLREEGNRMYRDRYTTSTNDIQILRTYDKAIFAAPAGSKALAQGHANRAVLLMWFGRYREAFDDCQLALSGAYPEENRLKVLFRQSECAEQLDDAYPLDTAITGLEAAASTRQLTTAGENKLSELKKRHEAVIGRSQDERDGSVKDELALPSLKEKENPAVGRHVVTAEPIAANGFIARERAFSFVPVYDPETRTTLPSYDCQKCARVNVVPFPCPTCARACYCSSRCREAHVAAHRFECFGYQRRLWRDVGIAHLGIRCLLDGFGTIREEMSNARDALSFFKHLLAHSADTGNDKARLQYGRVLRLVTNFDKMERMDVLQYALTGLMLTVYLRDCTEFFDPKNLPSGCKMSSSELFVLCGALITRHIGQLVCNGHAISELRASLDWADVEQTSEGPRPSVGLLAHYFTSARVFTAIFPRISMFNHSCDPNIRNHFEGLTLTVHATRLIEASGEIFNCYGPHYKLMPIEKRKELLKLQYCFDCNCDRCSTGRDAHSETFNWIKCPECGVNFSQQLDLDDTSDIRCQHCSGNISTEWYRTILDLTHPERPFTKNNFWACRDAYEKSKQILADFNYCRAHVLRPILDNFSKISSEQYELLPDLKLFALEYASLTRRQFGCMSLEFITGCFYLLDCLAIENLRAGHVPIDVGAEIRSTLDEFCAALSMVGSETRASILDYMERFVVTND